jgi:hypothetical protein
MQAHELTVTVFSLGAALALGTPAKAAICTRRAGERGSHDERRPGGEVLGNRRCWR